MGCHVGSMPLAYINSIKKRLKRIEREHIVSRYLFLFRLPWCFVASSSLEYFVSITPSQFQEVAGRRWPIMAIDCSDVPSNVAYDCANPWGVDCTSKFRFEFGSLWNYTQRIQAACANDTRLFLSKGAFATAQNASLTQDSCAAIAGSGWTYYSASHIWNRITTWKFPLLQLVASSPRPPLSFTVECLVILHLLGDPIDTMKNLILKMSTCQHTATHWNEKLLGSSVQDENQRSREDRELNWKALAIITDAYGEWNKGGLAQAALDEAL